MHPCLSRDKDGTIYHFNGMTPEREPDFNMALMMRTSKDNGVTWTAPQAILPRYSYQHMPNGTMFRTSNGLMIQNCDWYNNRLSTLVVSSDNGRTWTDRSAGEAVPPARNKGETGKGWIAGAHAVVTEISNGRLMAFARTGWGKPNRAIEGKSPQSISSDWGKTWTYTDSPFPVIASGQRMSLMRLKEGPILFVSFTSGQTAAKEGGRYPDDVRVGDNYNRAGMDFTDSEGRQFKGYGLFAALSRLSSSYTAVLVARCYVELVRNTPLLVQLFFIYFVLAPILDINGFTAAVLALSLFEGAYASEIFRAGILAVHRGQWEAAFSMGLDTYGTYRLVILPQAIRHILPPIASQAVSLIKDSALVSTIAIYDLTMQGQIIMAQTYLVFELWFIIAALYLAITTILSLGIHFLETRWKTTY
jgi:His/Glu/Gln/Arg/opine family amino acid ABC transporter permease subunit